MIFFHIPTMPSFSSLVAICFLSTFFILSAKAGPSTPAHAAVGRQYS
jgi:hypothetical protein